MEITTVIVNYQTPDYLHTAVSSFKKFYPRLPLLIVDNGSKDDSLEVINKLESDFENVSSQKLSENIYHGPAMDLAAREFVTSRYIFFLDSDTETLQGGFLEKMMESFLEDTSVYGVGELNEVNRRGFQGGKKELTILQTPYMLIDRGRYLNQNPFIHHGQPTMFNFEDAAKKGLRLKKFPVSEFVFHKWRGTADRFGYGLGWKGKIDFVLNKIGL